MLSRLMVICFLWFLFVFAWLNPAQAESVHVEEGWSASVSNFSGDFYYPSLDLDNNFSWAYATFCGFHVFADNYLRTTTNVLEPVYMPHEPWSRTTNGVLIDMHDGWVDTASDRVAVWPVMCLDDEWWYHVSFDWSTSWSDSPAANYLTWELWAGTGSSWGVAWRVTPGAGSHQGHVDMDVPLTFIGSPYFVLSLNPVPEPGDILTVLCGLGGLAVFTRRRRRN